MRLFFHYQYTFDFFMYLLFLVLYLIVFKLGMAVCPSNKVFIKVSKQNASPWAVEESYCIKNGASVLVQSPAFVNNELRVNEYCIISTQNNQYTVELKDSYGDSWDSGSWVQIEGIYGNIVFKAYMVDNFIEVYPLSLYYSIYKNSMWKHISYSVSGEWKVFQYDDSMWKVDIAGSVEIEQTGTQYFRKVFSGLTSMAAYETRLKYSDGIVVFLNGLEIYRDNMPFGIITSETLAILSYEVSSFHGFIRNGNDITLDSVLAVELHPRSISDTTLTVEFDCWMSLLARSTSSNCHVVGYPLMITSNKGDIPAAASNWVKSDGFTANNVLMQPQLTLSFDGDVIPAVNGIHIWVDGAIDDSPSAYLLSGTNSPVSSATYDKIISARNVLYFPREFNRKYAYFQNGAYRKYRLEVQTTVSSSLLINEMNLLVCSLARPSIIEYAHTSYSVYVTYEKVLIAPVLDDFSSCSIDHALPDGLSINAATCTVTGTSSVEMSSTMYVVSSTMDGKVYYGVFLLSVVRCQNILVELERTYKNDAIYEVFSIEDTNTHNQVFGNSVNSGQVDNTNWSYVLCLPQATYHVSLQCRTNYWQKQSYLFVSVILGESDRDLLLRARMDSYLGIASDYSFSTAFLIQPNESWNLTVNYVPAMWYMSHSSDWKTASDGSFPRSQGTIQLYKKTFVVKSFEDTAGILMLLRYQFGCIVHLNDVIVFHNGVIGNVTVGMRSTHKYSDVMYRSVTLPLRLSADGNNTQYLVVGLNVIAIEVVSDLALDADTVFDGALRLIGSTESSRIGKCYRTISTGMQGNSDGPFMHIHSESVHSESCDKLNSLTIAFCDDRREWVSSISIGNDYTSYTGVGSLSIEGSNGDNDLWKPLRIVKMLLWSAPAQIRKIFIAGDVPYNRYRLVNITSGNNSECSWRINSLDLYADDRLMTVPPLKYPSKITVYKAVEMADVYPNSQFYTDFVVIPQLPRGIYLDSEVGLIFGTPAVIKMSRTYTLKAERFNGASSIVEFVMDVDECVGKSSLITLTVRTDSYPSLSSYRLALVDDIKIPIAAADGFPVSNSFVYIDWCLPINVYSLDMSTTCLQGMKSPSGYSLSVDVLSMTIDIGQLPESHTPTSSVTTVFSSYMPFEICQSLWKVQRMKEKIEYDWMMPAYIDSSWPEMKSAISVTSEFVTIYLRRHFFLDNLNTYSVMNVRVRFSGGLVAYLNGNVVASFNMPPRFGCDTSCLVVRDVSLFSLFHIILAHAGAINGDNVIAFELHRHSSQSSAVPFEFDATGVFGVSDCSIVMDSLIDVTGTEAVVGHTKDALSTKPFSSIVLSNAVTTYIEWSTENLLGMKFNAFGILSPTTFSEFGFSLHSSLDDRSSITVLKTVNVTLTSRVRTLWSVPVAAASFKHMRWEIDLVSRGDVTINTFIFAYCKAKSGICPAIDEYPIVSEGQISPGFCPEGYVGYSYRVCADGILGPKKTDSCIPKQPAAIHYRQPLYLFIRGINGATDAPLYENIISRFYIDISTILPDGLYLDSSSGIIGGIPSISVNATKITIYGENSAGLNMTSIIIAIRIAECLDDDGFMRTEAGNVAVAPCSLNKKYFGTRRRQCILGKNDGEWGDITGICVSHSFVIAILLGIVVIMLVVLCIYASKLFRSSEPEFDSKNFRMEEKKRSLDARISYRGTSV